MATQNTLNIRNIRVNPTLLGNYRIASKGEVIHTGNRQIQLTQNAFVRDNWAPGEIFTARTGNKYCIGSDGALRSC